MKTKNKITFIIFFILLLFILNLDTIFAAVEYSENYSTSCSCNSTGCCGDCPYLCNACPYWPNTCGCVADGYVLYCLLYYGCQYYNYSGGESFSCNNTSCAISWTYARNESSITDFCGCNDTTCAVNCTKFCSCSANSQSQAWIDMTGNGPSSDDKCGSCAAADVSKKCSINGSATTDNICKLNVTQNSAGCCHTSNECWNGSNCIANGTCESSAYCTSGNWVQDGDHSQSACDCLAGTARWNLGGEVSPTTCCGDDSGEYKRVNNLNSNDMACCDSATDCVLNGVCYSDGTCQGSLYCNSGNWVQDGDHSQSACDCLAGIARWNLGGEVSPTTCCGDDANEYKRTFSYGNDSKYTSDNASPTCCNSSTDCIKDDSCTASGSSRGDSALNRVYCLNGTWYGGDYSQEACNGIVGTGYWNLGGEVSPTTCCGDDSGEYQRVNNLNSNDMACCDSATDCVLNGVCYSDGTFQSGYVCTSGFWRYPGRIILRLRGQEIELYINPQGLIEIIQ